MTPISSAATTNSWLGQLSSLPVFDGHLRLYADSMLLKLYERAVYSRGSRPAMARSCMFDVPS